MSRNHREALLLEAARWFGWAADACRVGDRVDARKCGIYGIRVLARLRPLGTPGAQHPGRHLADEIAFDARTKEEG